MVRSTGRLVPAPDEHSDSVVCRHKTKKERPRSGPGAGNTWCEAGPTPRPLRSRGADMAQSTRGVPGSDSETRISTVKITPVLSVSATVPSISSVA
jgi:hypothetical protein